MSPNVYFIITQDGNISLVLNGNTNSIGKSHPNYDAIRECLKTGVYDELEKLIDIPKAVNAYMDGNVMVNAFGEVTYQGNVIDNTVATRITQFFMEGLPYKPLVRFLENLMSNPSFRSVQELYKFLEHNGLPLTEDGCFVGYKGVNADFTDKHSGTFDNTPGITVPREGLKMPSIPRNMVDDNGANTCSRGLHVGTQTYASNFAGGDGRVVLVKVNPANAVSVPFDHDATKLRVTEYEVLCEAEKTLVLQGAMYPTPSESEPEEEQEEEKLCNVCGEATQWKWCDCEQQEEEEDVIDMAYEAGKEAFNKDLNIQANPHSHEENLDLYDSWDNGWQNAADDYAQTGGIG